MDSITVLIPAHNERMHIEAVVLSASRFLPVLVVDDGSTDTTSLLAEEAGATVIRHPVNRGKGAALLTGFQACYQAGFQAAITLDGDGQHDPDEIPLFLQAFAHSHAGLIIGMRDFSQMPPVRRAANTLGRWIFSAAVGQSIPDNQSGYRLVSRPLMELMLQTEEQGFEFEVDMVALCLKHRLGLEWVPIRTIYGDEKSHIQPLQHVANYFRITRNVRRRMRE